MSNIVFTTESPADIYPEYKEKYGIGVIPLHVNQDGVDYKDGEITAQEIYDTFRQKKVLPNTSAIPIAEYMDFFKAYLDEGKEIIHVSMSSGISSTYRNACLAVEELEASDRIHVIDSKCCAHAIALPIYKGIGMAEKGMTTDEILDEINKLVPKIDNHFMITNLEFLKHGGRCSALAAFGANLLRIKPLIDMSGGEMSVSKKYRGSDITVYKKSLDDLLGDGNYDDEFACITNVLVDDDVLKEYVDYLKKNFHFKNILVSDASCTITSHGGKGAIGTFFLKK